MVRALVGGSTMTSASPARIDPLPEAPAPRVARFAVPFRVVPFRVDLRPLATFAVPAGFAALVALADLAAFAFGALAFADLLVELFFVAINTIWPIRAFGVPMIRGSKKTHRPGAWQGRQLQVTTIQPLTSRRIACPWPRPPGRRLRGRPGRSQPRRPPSDRRVPAPRGARASGPVDWVRPGGGGG